MKTFFSSKMAKAIVDILLVAGFFLSYFSGRNPEQNSWWGSLHCISSMTWYALMIVHIAQHWKMTKVLLKWKVMKRNKISFLTLVVFILMTVSVIIFIPAVNDKSMHIHHVISHVFWPVIIIHTVQKTKRFFQLFKTGKKVGV